jgi:hypothetical protein
LFYGRLVFDLAFPYYENIPANGQQGGFVSIVAGLISPDFLFPIFSVGFRDACAPLAVVAVPKAPVDKKNLPPTRKNKVRFSREVFTV